MNVDGLLKFLKDKEPISSSEIFLNFNVEEQEFKRILNSALDLGMINKIGQKRGTKYYVGPIREELKVSDTPKPQKTSTEDSNDDIEDYSDRSPFEEKVRRYKERKDPIYGYVSDHKPILPTKLDEPSLFSFVKDGANFYSATINYNKEAGENLVVEETKTIYNEFTLIYNSETREYEVRFFDHSKRYYRPFHVVAFKTYNKLEDFLKEAMK